MNVEKLIAGVIAEANAIRANVDRRKKYKLSTDLKDPYSILFSSSRDAIGFLRKNNIAPFSSGLNDFIKPSRTTYYEYSADFRPFTPLEYYLNSQQCNAVPILNHVINGWPLVREML